MVFVTDICPGDIVGLWVDHNTKKWWCIIVSVDIDNSNVSVTLSVLVGTQVQQYKFHKHVQLERVELAQAI